METIRESSWPQPHEHVTGIHRTRDDLLSLEGPALRRRVVMMTMANDLWKAARGNARDDHGRDAYKRMSEPRVGDLVIESGSMRNPGADSISRESRFVHGFGILLGEREEWSCSHEEWAEFVAEEKAEGQIMTLADRLTVMSTYVQYGPSPADVVRWQNCSFIALPTGPLHHTEGGQE